VSQLAGIISRLVDALNPEMVYVFGSRARGGARADSDVDLMVVVTDSNLPGYRRDQEAYRIAEGRDFALDLVVVTRSEFEEWLDNPASFSATVLREGKALYAA
jgi:predicted nucleotidyltransferase